MTSTGIANPARLRAAQQMHSNDVAAAIGQAIEEARISAGHTQASLGRILGVNTSTVSRWETGERSLGVDRIADIADALESTSLRLLERVMEVLATPPDEHGPPASSD